MYGSYGKPLILHGFRAHCDACVWSHLVRLRKQHGQTERNLRSFINRENFDFHVFFEIPNPTSGRQTKSDPTSGRKTKSYRRRRHEEEGDEREPKSTRQNQDVMNECSGIVWLIVLEVSPGGPPDVPSWTPRKPSKWVRGLLGPKIVKF